MSLPGNDICLLEVEDFNLYEEEAADHAFARDSDPDKLISRGGVKMEAEKRIRREIANSNERRRMQSINAGFQALRTLLPRHEGEKLSKAAILQQTAEYIYSLEQEKTRLLSQNCQLKRLLNQHEGGEMPLKKRKSEILSHHTTSTIPDSTEDAANSRSPEPVYPKKEESGELRAQLERERRLRALLEEQVRALEEHRPAAPAPLVAPPPAPAAPPVPAVAVVVAPAPVKAEAEAPLLEAAIKAEPRVEVEVLPDPHSRLYLASTSRQNLETIVEAIRHLEGDHLFQEAGEGAAEAPLALITRPALPPLPPLPPHPALAQQPSRPGVIVVKQS